MKLNYKKSGAGQPLIILHGLFGMLDNWQSIANSLSDDFEVWLVDQRNHGRSPHSEIHTYDAMADDLLEFIEEHKLHDVVVVGHSMGGKTALRFAQKYPGKVAGFVVVDMGMKQYGVYHDFIVEALQSVPLNDLATRSEAEDYLKKHIDSFSIRQFLLKNLHRNADGTYRWRFNLEVLDRELPTSIVSALPQEKSNDRILFIYGTQSNYIVDEDLPELKKWFPNSTYEPLDADHWVHAEKPRETAQLIVSFALERNGFE